MKSTGKFYVFVAIAASTLAGVVFAAPSLADEYAQGAAAYSAGDFSGAKAHLIKATQAKPKSWQAHYQLANTYVQLKDSANAKMSYQKCIANNPPADIKTNCITALSYIGTNPKLTAPVAPTPPRPVQMIAPKQATASDSTSDEPSEHTVNADLEARRAKIIAEGEAEVTRMKQQEKEKQEEAEANANQRYIYPDGTVKTSLSTEEMAQMQREIDQKASQIRDRARRKAEALR
ncbi:MAG: hypothetical protein U0103_13125 [Candidatus Obscuribacterales bacterium]